MDFEYNNNLKKSDVYEISIKYKNNNSSDKYSDGVVC